MHAPAGDRRSNAALTQQCRQMVLYVADGFLPLLGQHHSVVALICVAFDAHSMAEASVVVDSAGGCSSCDVCSFCKTCSFAVPGKGTLQRLVSHIGVNWLRFLPCTSMN